jgi:glutaredoxin
VQGDVYLYGLSFCESCREGRRLLEELGLAFRMTHLDQLEPDVRRPVLHELRAMYGKSVLYPVLEVDGEFTFGFEREAWTRALAPVLNRH